MIKLNETEIESTRTEMLNCYKEIQLAEDYEDELKEKAIILINESKINAYINFLRILGYKAITYWNNYQYIDYIKIIPWDADEED